MTGVAFSNRQIVAGRALQCTRLILEGVEKVLSGTFYSRRPGRSPFGPASLFASDPADAVNASSPAHVRARLRRIKRLQRSIRGGHP
jgi:hypothetical protein